MYVTSARKRLDTIQGLTRTQLCILLSSPTLSVLISLGSMAGRRTNWIIGARAVYTFAYIHISPSLSAQKNRVAAY